MARPLRPNIAGAVYHVMSRGIEKKAIYRDDQDREEFLKTIGRVARRYEWQCLAYCLMANHYHLVLRTPQPNLSRGMGVANSAYAMAFNNRYEREGHLFQGRFRSVLVLSSPHLRIAIRYVCRNPVAASICAHPGDWKWSSYRATLAATQDRLVAGDATLAWFGEGETARERFVRLANASDTDPIDDAFFEEVSLPYEPNDPVERPALEQILARQPGASGIAEAHSRHGYSLREIAHAIGVSKATACRLLVAYEAEEMRTASTWPRVA